MRGLGYLHGKLPRGDEHEPARHAPPGGLPPFCGGGRACFVEEPVDHRQDEGGCLAGAGCRLRQDVASGEHHRDRLPLDGGGLFVAEARNGGHERLGEPEVREA